MMVWYVWYIPGPCELAGVFSSEEKAIEYKDKMIAASWDGNSWSIGYGMIDVPLMPILAPVGHN